MDYSKIPIKTHFVTISDKIEDVVFKYAIPLAKKGDILVLCEKIVSITQNRVIEKKDIRLSFWAKFLSKFAKKTPSGFSVGNPYKMQVAINLAGLLRILFASFMGGIGKLIGWPGLFYIIAGNAISRIDGFYGETFAQYADLGILGCIKGDEVCNNLRNKYGYSFAIADVNDLGGNILGLSFDLKGKEKMLLDLLADNPATQSAQQTPIVILRESRPSVILSEAKNLAE
jgi:hypothetical protein